MMVLQMKYALSVMSKTKMSYRRVICGLWVHAECNGVQYFLLKDIHVIFVKDAKVKIKLNLTIS